MSINYIIIKNKKMSTKSKKTVKATAKTVKAVTKMAPKATKAVASKTVKVVAKSTPATPSKTVSKKAKTSNRNTIAVVQLTPRGRRIRKYNSMSDAERATGVNTGSISKVVRGIMKTAGGFVWANA
jgi:muramoyltetrapeptide carboxypeptidase LdcA involved in peptidoglycan recycling